MAQSEGISLKKHKKESEMFSKADICRIIKIARSQGVKFLDLGEFKVSFYEKESKTKSVSGFEGKLNPPNENMKPTASKPVAAQKESIHEHDQRVLMELQQAQLLIDDPAAYEAAEIDAALNPEGAH